MFSLYALLGKNSPSLSNESLVIGLKQYFRDAADFSLAFERLPFAKHDTLALRWGNWLVRVSYEEGESGSCLGMTRNRRTRTRCFT
ncbi:hypothetical protein [Ralstonia solanacearum]|uniref:Uncharacterized protein n=1 Tax=Ralstonia solanacearum CFBP2957 TaxID=859656 RepID=D8P566_RALSL|nr:hypothetical protein [Ralstonia solanacearum]CBJ54052.1 protein of unknown function [Ralstonia solanacearum CFBP2957]